MALRREIETYIDVPNSNRVKLQGESLVNADSLGLYISQQILFKVHLLTEYGIYYVPSSGATWYFGINPAYTEAADDVIQVGNSDFISTDWGDADFDNGKICWRVDLTGTDLVDDLGTTAYKNYYCGLWMTPSGEKPVCLVEWTSTIHNLATYVITPTTQTGKTYVTTDMLDAYLRKSEPYEDTRFVNGIMYKYNQDDSKWYPLVVRNVDGQASLVLGEGVATI